ncbi:MAG: hypothetical protein CMC86_01935, partial [Flavobacteriaceae bacterium]|nr:hypothetical protein [Flavobacteriaceae bacterium]
MNINFFRTLIIVFISYFGNSQQNVASIELIHFDSSLTYAPESSVSIHFNPSGIFEFRDDGDDNQFYIELSNSSGTFSSNTTILDQSISNSFFTTTLNGIIPTINEVGDYKLRVVATKALLSNGSYGLLPSETSVDVTIQTNISGSSLITYSSTPVNSQYFDCTNNDQFYTDPMFGSLLAEPSTTSGTIISQLRRVRISNFDSSNTYNISRIDVINNSIINLGELQSSSFTMADDLPIGTYNYMVTNTNSSGISSAYTIVFVLHRSSTTIANASGEEICVGNIVDFYIDRENTGIRQNYRGSYYTIDFGDNSDPELYTHAEILFNNTLSHVYSSLSCGIGSGELTGYFNVDKQLYNKYNTPALSSCEYRTIGNGVQKKINTSLAPQALFESESICENQDLVVTNLTTLGQYGYAECSDEAVFYWEITNPNGLLYEPSYLYGEIYDDNNNWLTDINGDNLIDIVIPANQLIPGCWTFRLISINELFCQQTSYFPLENQSPYVVNVETFPDNSGIYDFNIISNNQEVSSLCVGGSVSLIDNSNLNNFSCQNPSYLWTISPDQGFSFINPFNENSQNPQINFNQAGVYTITQEITNLCGFTSVSKELIVEGSPSVTFADSSDQICIISSSIPYTVNFFDQYTPAYSDIPYAPSSYSWSITGVDVDPSDYDFINNTSANDPYPIISFNNFKDFTISLTVDGDCQDSNYDEIILFINQIPEINNSSNSQVLCSGDLTNNILFESSLSSGVNYSWTTISDSYISGYFNNGVGSSLPSHQLMNNSDVSGTVTYSVAPYTNDCMGESIDFSFIINPKPLISDKTLVICENQSFSLIDNLSSSDILPASTIFTWDLPISFPENAVTGGVQGNGPNIFQTLTNNTSSPATLSYIVSSSTAEGCNGNNFNLNVTVNPTAQVNQPPSQVVCNGDITSVIEFNTENT